GMFEVTGYAAAGNNAAQVQIFADLFSGIVKATAQAQVAVIRVHKNIYAVKRVAFRVMGVEFAFADNLLVGMFIAVVRIFYNYGERAGNYFSFIFNTNLAFGKMLKQSRKFLLGPGTAEIRIDHIHDLFNGFVIGK